LGSITREHSIDDAWESQSAGLEFRQENFLTDATAFALRPKDAVLTDLGQHRVLCTDPSSINGCRVLLTCGRVFDGVMQVGALLLCRFAKQTAACPRSPRIVIRVVVLLLATALSGQSANGGLSINDNIFVINRDTRLWSAVRIVAGLPHKHRKM